MAENLEYSSKTQEVGTGLVDFELTVPHKILYFTVPRGVVASVRLGSNDNDALPLNEGAQRLCLPFPPGKIYLTASAGDPVKFFSATDVVVDYFDQLPNIGVENQASRKAHGHGQQITATSAVQLLNPSGSGVTVHVSKAYVWFNGGLRVNVHLFNGTPMTTLHTTKEWRDSREPGSPSAEVRSMALTAGEGDGLAVNVLGTAIGATPHDLDLTIAEGWSCDIGHIVTLPGDLVVSFEWEEY